MLLEPIDAKVMRADRHGRELAESIAAWTVSSEVRHRGEYSDERRRFRIIVEDFNPAPDFTQWGLLVGDCAHNLRSALDNLAFALARLERDPPRDPRGVTFPIYVDEDAFDREGRSRIKQLPPAAANIITALQPFQPETPIAGVVRAADLLLALHRLNNADKHQIPRIVLLAPTEIAFNVTVAFFTDEAAAANVPPDMTIWADPVGPGVVLLEQRAKDPIKEVTLNLSGTWQVSLHTASGYEPCGNFMRMLGRCVWEVIGLFRPLFEP